MRASIEFVQMSAGSRDLLADLIAEFERLAAANKLRLVRMETEEELRREMKQAGVRVARLGGRNLLTARELRKDSSGHESAERERIVEVMPLVLRVDLFG